MKDNDGRETRRFATCVRSWSSNCFLGGAKVHGARELESWKSVNLDFYLNIAQGERVIKRGRERENWQIVVQVHFQK